MGAVELFDRLLGLRFLDLFLNFRHLLNQILGLQTILVLAQSLLRGQFSLLASVEFNRRRRRQRGVSVVAECLLFLVFRKDSGLFVTIQRSQSAANFAPWVGRILHRVGNSCHG